jgi:hypothetical protein
VPVDREKRLAVFALLISLAMKLPKSSGEPPPISAPKSFMRLTSSGERSTAFASALSLSTMARGMPAGPISPYHDEAYTPGTPTSSNVGTLGSAGLRFFDATASARILPAAMKGRQVVVSSITDTWPATRSASAGAVPLYGTCCMSMPATCMNWMAARCCDEPTPPEP